MVRPTAIVDEAWRRPRRRCRSTWSTSGSSASRSAASRRGRSRPRRQSSTATFVRRHAVATDEWPTRGARSSASPRRSTGTAIALDDQHRRRRHRRTRGSERSRRDPVGACPGSACKVRNGREIDVRRVRTLPVNRLLRVPCTRCVLSRAMSEGAAIPACSSPRTTAASASRCVRALRLEGYDVDAVDRRRAGAWRWWNRDPPDLLVLDIMMPNVDGLTVCRRLRAPAGDACRS